MEQVEEKETLVPEDVLVSEEYYSESHLIDLMLGFEMALRAAEPERRKFLWLGHLIVLPDEAQGFKSSVRYPTMMGDLEFELEVKGNSVRCGHVRMPGAFTLDERTLQTVNYSTFVAIKGLCKRAVSK